MTEEMKLNTERPIFNYENLELKSNKKVNGRKEERNESTQMMVGENTAR